MNYISITFILLFQAACLLSKAATFPEDKLPPFITKVSEYGERCEWSKDAKKMLYITKTGEDVEELDLATGEVRVIARARDGKGYYRANYLVNGDYALTWGIHRRKPGPVLQIISKDLSKITNLDVTILEGAAFSRRNMKIAWTPDLDLIYIGEIVYGGDGTPEVANKELLVDMTGKLIEPQDFKGKGPNDEELIFTCYHCGHNEVYGINLLTKDTLNYSKDKQHKEEPEGIFPSGRQTLVESDKLSDGQCGEQCIEVYALVLDSTGENWERLTHFQDFNAPNGGKYKASNPAVRNNGRQFCFQEAVMGQAAGVGQGLYIYDLEDAGYQWIHLEDGAAIPPDTLIDETAPIIRSQPVPHPTNHTVRLRDGGVVLSNENGLMDIQGRVLPDKASVKTSDKCSD